MVHAPGPRIATPSLPPLSSPPPRTQVPAYKPTPSRLSLSIHTSSVISRTGSPSSWPARTSVRSGHAGPRHAECGALLDRFGLWGVRDLHGSTARGEPASSSLQALIEFDPPRLFVPIPAAPHFLFSPGREQTHGRGCAVRALAEGPVKSHYIGGGPRDPRLRSARGPAGPSGAVCRRHSFSVKPCARLQSAVRGGARRPATSCPLLPLPLPTHGHLQAPGTRPAATERPRPATASGQQSKFAGPFAILQSLIRVGRSGATGSSRPNTNTSRQSWDARVAGGSRVA